MGFQTIEQFINQWYGSERRHLSGLETIRRADDPLLTTDEGTYNATYGAYAWSAINYEANYFGMFAKYPMQRPGFRMRIQRANIVDGGTVAETGSVPDSVRGRKIPIRTRNKIIALKFNVSMLREAESKTQADTTGGMATERRDTMDEFKLVVSENITRDGQGIAAALTGDYDYLADNYPTSVDTLVSSRAEAVACDTDSHNAYDSYGEFIRSANGKSHFDATVLSASGGAIDSGNGPLVKELFTKFKKTILSASGQRPTMYVMDHSLKGRVDDMFDPQTRYTEQAAGNSMGSMAVEYGANGAMAASGKNVILRVGTIGSIPLFETQRVVTNTADSKEGGRIFAFNGRAASGTTLPNIGFQLLVPPTYAENSQDNSAGLWPLNGADKFESNGMYFMSGEMILRAPKTCGKYRDIQEA